MSSRVLVNVTRFVALLLFLALALFILTPGSLQRIAVPNKDGRSECQNITARIKCDLEDIDCGSTVNRSIPDTKNQSTQRLLFKLPQERAIYFLETSGSKVLNLRQACAVEAAARSHRGMPVHVFISSFRFLHNHVIMRTLQKLNISFSLLDKAALFAHTPLESFFTKDKLSLSKYPVEHTSDVLRLVVLWKYGGIYLDFDAITLKSMEGLQNSIALGDLEGTGIGTGVLVFDKGHLFLRLCLERLSNDFNGDSWTYNGPRLIKQTIEDNCAKPTILSMIFPTKVYYGAFNNCMGLHLLPTSAFYPIHWENYSLFFNYHELSPKLSHYITSQSSYSVHLYNKLTAPLPVRIGSGQLFETLASQYCPLVYDIMKSVKVF